MGPGLFESAYEFSLEQELIVRKIFVERQKVLPLIYKNVNSENGYKIDFLVENKVIIELKSVESISNLHIAQLLTYLKLSKLKW